jgi:excinuclease UvrABC nuclease subunit
VGVNEEAKLFEASLAVEPPLDEAQLAKVPAKRGVVLLRAGDEPIVLLTAGDIRRRVATRLAERQEEGPTRTADLRQITTAIDWRLCFSHFESDLAFLEIANQLYPRKYGEMLAWKRPRFVRVDPAEEFPAFGPTRQPQPMASGLCIGPFPSGRSVEAFIDAIQDAFDLCRHERCLRQAPHGQPCTYAQMNRCLRVCCGGMSLEDYRQVVARAARFAAGERQPTFDELRARMHQAAAELEFELAGLIKSKLERLSRLESPEYHHLAPLEEFRFLLVEPGPRFDKARVFGVNWGQVFAEDIDYPLSQQQLEGLLARMAQVEAPARLDELAQWRVALVSSMLLAAPSRAGLVVRYGAGLTAESLAAQIAEVSQLLKLREPRRRNKAKSKDDPAQPPCESERVESPGMDGENGTAGRGSGD